MHDNSQELLPLVNELGEVTGSATRGECHGGTMLLHPVVHLHVFNPAGELYLQKRPEWKDIQPGKWDTAVGGHIDLGEEVMVALRREAMEEISLTSFSPTLLDMYVHQSTIERELIYAFTTITELPLCPTAELDTARFFTTKEIRSHLATGFFTPNFEKEWLRLFGNKA